MKARMAIKVVGVIAAAYTIGFAFQSVRTERSCFGKRHGAAFYVSPWTLHRYCTIQGSGAAVTYEE